MLNSSFSAFFKYLRTFLETIALQFAAEMLMYGFHFVTRGINKNKVNTSVT